MRRSEERRQWEHTDEEEALHGFGMTNSVDMPPSLRNEFDAMANLRSRLATVTAQIEQVQKDRDRYGADLATARESRDDWKRMCNEAIARAEDTADRLDEADADLATERGALKVQLEGQQATVRVHEFTIRQVSTERDAARRERDEALKDVENWKEVAFVGEKAERALEADLATVTAERDRLKALLEEGSRLPAINWSDWAKRARRALVVTPAPLPTPPANYADIRYCPTCHQPTHIIVQDPPTPPAGTPSHHECPSCDLDDSVKIPGGKLLKSTPIKRCAEWCGGETEPSEGVDTWLRNGRWYCTGECFDAQRSAHPRGEEPPRLCSARYQPGGEHPKCDVCGGDPHGYEYVEGIAVAPSPCPRKGEPRCRCGSGAHPRRCEIHPARYAEHVAEINADFAALRRRRRGRSQGK